jgi:hypothetical protein
VNDIDFGEDCVFVGDLVWMSVLADLTGFQVKPGYFPNTTQFLPQSSFKMPCSEAQPVVVVVVLGHISKVGIGELQGFTR